MTAIVARETGISIRINGSANNSSRYSMIRVLLFPGGGTSSVIFPSVAPLGLKRRYQVVYNLTYSS